MDLDCKSLFYSSNGCCLSRNPQSNDAKSHSSFSERDRTPFSFDSIQKCVQNGQSRFS